jgi:predicted LPLAT superfamily acyltransferase
MNPPPPPSRIKVRKRGNRAGIFFFILLTRIGGLSAAYAMLYMVCIYYVLVDRETVRSTRAYVRRIHPKANGLRQHWMVYQLFISQGRQLIDRYALLSGRFPFRVGMEGRDAFVERVSGPKGLILLTSHVGNWQMVMSALEKINKPIHLVMRPEDNAAVREAFQLDRGGGAIRIISIDSPFGGVVDIMTALREGHIVSIMGDRPYDFDTVTVNFLGAPARFPYSGFKIAAMADVPVAVMYSAKTGKSDYTIEVPVIYEPKQQRKGSKQDRWGPYVQAYAQSLESFVQRHPLQFFAFQDLWNDKDDET